uniref:Cytochrome b-c1 complex subunit 7 n=1 Tax=Rhinopithecus bieti TaxID=61621 RepID=A0A2K6KMZ8_RHIBE
SDLSTSGKWLDHIQKWYYNAAGFNNLRLIRLPENLYNDRMFHIKRALDLTMKHQILPKEQWTKYEEENVYLELYLKEVIRERKEREEWAKK